MHDYERLLLAQNEASMCTWLHLESIKSPRLDIYFFCQRPALKNPPCFVLLQHKKCELKCALMKILSEKCFEFFKFSNANLLREEINSKFFKYGLMETPFLAALHCDRLQSIKNWTAYRAVDMLFLKGFLCHVMMLATRVMHTQIERGCTFFFSTILKPKVARKN